ncbi:MAG TPA: hypothetical protein VMV47_10810 [Bacteroidales bacterium]|nr:hypothetical protein [Bacteroidales bacterium]
MMKRSLFIILVVFFFAGTIVNAQGLLKKVGKAMSDELIGTTPSTGAKKTEQPEPSCACDKPEMVMDMGGKLQLDYKELTISISNDGRVLAKHFGSDEYYIVKDGVTQGPYKGEDPQVKSFEVVSDEVPEDVDPWTYKYKQYISKKDGKYLITFGGKTYGPYGQIQNFAVTLSKDKFAALIIENVVVTEDQGKAMDEAMKNAKNDQERMDLALKYSAAMQQKIIQGGGPGSMVPKLVSNIEGISYDWTNNMGGSLNSSMKYDEILLTIGSDIKDLKGNNIHTVTPDQGGADFFISSDNSKYAWHQYGTLNISDKTTLSELFNPHLVKVEGKIYLAYMYYSPKKNSILQCKLPF